MASLKKDDNSVAVAGGVSDLDGVSILPFKINHTTGRLMLSAVISGGGFVGSQEKSTTVPNGILQTFSFTHTPTVIFWNGAFQTLTDDYTVSSLTITFTGTQTPQTGDKIVNLYA